MAMMPGLPNAHPFYHQEKFVVGKSVKRDWMPTDLGTLHLQRISASP